MIVVLAAVVLAHVDGGAVGLGERRAGKSARGRWRAWTSARRVERRAALGPAQRPARRPLRGAARASGGGRVELQRRVVERAAEGPPRAGAGAPRAPGCPAPPRARARSPRPTARAARGLLPARGPGPAPRRGRGPSTSSRLARGPCGGRFRHSGTLPQAGRKPAKLVTGVPSAARVRHAQGGHAPGDRADLRGDGSLGIHREALVIPLLPRHPGPRAPDAERQDRDRGGVRGRLRRVVVAGLEGEIRQASRASDSSSGSASSARR